MKVWWISLTTAIVLALGAPAAGAAVDHATAESLMHGAGLWKMFDHLERQAVAGMDAQAARRQSTPNAPSEAEHARLRQALGAAFAAARLRTVCRAVLVEGLDAAHIEALRRWYASPDGVAITKLEDAAAADTGDPQRRMQEGAQAFEQASAERQALMRDIVEITRQAEMMVDLTVGTTIAMLQGLASVQPGAPAPTARELRAALEAQRGQMLQAFGAMALASSALAYAPLPTASLAAYRDFLRSEAGRHFYDVAWRGVGAAIGDASGTFGRSLPGTRDPSNT